MIFNMHCRLSSPTNNSTYSSCLFSHSDYTNTLNHRTYSSSSYHGQIPVPQRRRRLEDPVLTHASNYYVTNPRQTSPSSQTSSLASPRRIRQKSEDKNTYCDLFNLLERPPPMKPRKKYISKDSNPYRGHRSIVHGKIKDINERKRHHHQQQSSCYKENKYPKQQYNQLEEKKCIYQQHLTNKGFFRRVVRNYFCMPMTDVNGEFSN